jgi:uncharacterized membrane protein YobD (UPF0266 family)
MRGGKMIIEFFLLWVISAMIIVAALFDDRLINQHNSKTKLKPKNPN